MRVLNSNEVNQVSGARRTLRSGWTNGRGSRFGGRRNNSTPTDNSEEFVPGVVVPGVVVTEGGGPLYSDRPSSEACWFSGRC